MTTTERHIANLHEEIHIAAHKAKFFRQFADAHLHCGNVDDAEFFRAKADAAARSAERLTELIPIIRVP